MPSVAREQLGERAHGYAAATLAEVAAPAMGMVLPGFPIAAEGETFDEALDEMVIALREHAED